MKSRSWFQPIKCGRTILLLPNSRGFAPKDIAAFLIETGADKQTPVYICENITLENEKITSSTLEEHFGTDFWFVMRNGYQANRLVNR